jgi:hypothetical protein
MPRQLGGEDGAVLAGYSRDEGTHRTA